MLRKGFLFTIPLSGMTLFSACLSPLGAQTAPLQLQLVKGYGTFGSSTWAYAVDGELWDDPDKLVYLEGPDPPWAIFKIVEADQPVVVDGFGISTTAVGLKSHIQPPRRFKLFVSETDTAHDSFHLVLWDTLTGEWGPPQKNYFFDPVPARYIKLVVTPPPPNSYLTLVRVTEIALYSCAHPFLLRRYLTVGYVDKPYADTLRVKGVPPGAWIETEGLPQGLSLDPLTGAVSGVPREAFDGMFTVRIRRGTEVLAEFEPKLTILEVPDLVVGVDPTQEDQLVLLPLRSTDTSLQCADEEIVRIPGLGHPIRVASNPTTPAVIVNSTAENTPGQILTLDLATRSVAGKFPIPFALRGLSVLGCDSYLALRDDRNFLFTTSLPSDGNLTTPLLQGMFDLAVWPGDSCTAFVLQQTIEETAVWKLIFDQGEGIVLGPVVELPQGDWARIAVTQENIWLTTYKDPPNSVLRVPSQNPDSRVAIKIPATINRFLAHPYKEVVYGGALEDTLTNSFVTLTASDTIDTCWVEVGRFVKDLAFSPDYRHLLVLGDRRGQWIYHVDLDEKGRPTTRTAHLCRQLRYGLRDISTATAIFEPAILSLEVDGGTPGRPSQIFVKLNAKYPVTGLSFTLKVSPNWFDFDSVGAVIGPSYQDYNVGFKKLADNRLRVLIDSARQDSTGIVPARASDPTVCAIVFKVDDHAPYIGRALFALDSVRVSSYDFDHKSRLLPVVLQDMPFELGTYSRGDLNRDGQIDLLDLFLACDVIAEPAEHPVQDVLRTDLNLDGEPNLPDIERLRGEILLPSLPWPRDPNLPKRSPTRRGVRQVLLRFEHRGDALDIVGIKLRGLQNTDTQLQSVEETPGKRAWLYGKQLRNGKLAVFAVSQNGKLNGGSPYYKLILNLDTKLPAEQAAEFLQVASVEAITASGQLVHPRVEILPAQQAQILHEDSLADADVKTDLKAFPNPFNASTRVAFFLPHRTHARLCVYDVRGRLIATLLDATVEAGKHSVVWESTDQRGASVPSGIYFCRLEAGGKQITQKVLLVR